MSYEQRIEGLLEGYRKQQAQAADVRRQVGEISAVVIAPRQVVKVAVGSQGEVTALEFPTGAFRRMAPVELAEVILSTIEEARGKALAQLAQVTDVALGGMLEGVNLADLIQGKVDPLTLFPDGPPMAPEVRNYIDRGRRE
jgi:DNA-binding protein YbaB